MRKTAEALNQLDRAKRSALLDAIDTAQDYTGRAKRCMLMPAAASEEAGQFIAYLDDAIHQLFAARRLPEDSDPRYRVEALTTQHRSGHSFPGWPRTRHLLRERGVNPNTTLLAEVL